MRDENTTTLTAKPNAAVPATIAVDDEWNSYDQLGISGRRRQVDRLALMLIMPLGATIAGMTAWARRHWLLLFNTANLLLFLGTFASPLLYQLGWPTLARPAFTVYSILCLQRPTHSFFLWGYPMGMEQRMVAIPAAQAVAGLLYAVLRRYRFLRPLNAWWVLAGSTPMLVDIFSQSLGGRVSDAFWRTTTGILFGVLSIWLFGPLLDWAWHPGNPTRKVTLRRDGSWHFPAPRDRSQTQLARDGTFLAEEPMNIP